jgi:hypothetical protein
MILHVEEVNTDINKTRLRVAKQIVAREMHTYDSMSNPPRYRVEAPKIAERDTKNQPGPNTTFSCAHAIPLDEQCIKCQRLDWPWADVEIYRKAKRLRVAELLKEIITK